MAGSSRRSGPRARLKSSDESGDVSSIKPPHLKPLSKRRPKDDDNLLRIFNLDIKVMVCVSFVAFLIIALVIYNVFKRIEQTQLPTVITPFPSHKLLDLPQFQGEHKESLYWGTYRPHVYFGVRARTPRSLVAGLMWIGVKDGRYYMRHVCQDSDDLRKYGWTQHNGRDFGHQVLVDHDLKLETSFLKSKSEGSGYGGDWAVRVGIEKEKLSGNDMLSNGHLFFYLADEDENSLNVRRKAFNINGDSLLVSGSRMDVGDWHLHLASKDAVELHFSGFKTSHIHNISDLVQHNLAVQISRFGQLQLSESFEDTSNLVVFQMSAKTPFKIDLVFVSGIEAENSKLDERLNSLSGVSLTQKLQVKQSEFDAKFEKKFNVADKLEPESLIVGKAAVANMLGGIGYFYGQSKISYPRNSGHKGHQNFLEYWPAELFTAVPSRPFFPRGFLWDEGFHQLLIWRWDIHISLDIVGHWLDLMNIDGWIPREQILGAEALSKVPDEFVVQYPSNGNPPTLFLVINDLLKGISANKFSSSEHKEITSFLERASVRLEAWFQWFNTTQAGKETSSYYWHGRDRTTTHELNPKTLSSGLDDYPRASHPNDEESHLDLRCWMLLASNCMHSITQLLENENWQGKEYHSTAKLLSDFDLLNQMHFDPGFGAYFDYGNHTEKVRLSWKETRLGNREFLRDVFERPELRLVPHIGYVSLFPLMRRIIPADSWILEKQLDLISNRSILWTDYGLRSLSKTSSLYMKRNTEHDPPYWRGPIWINMNYMILSALHHYSQEDGPYKGRTTKIYKDLRGNLIRNLVENYHRTGFLWEQYDQKNGKGKGARLFTGWTALLVLIMSESYT